MFEIELDEVEEEFGAVYGIEMKFKAIDMIRSAFIKSHPLFKFEGDLWIFKSAVDAVQAAIDMKQLLHEYNAKQQHDHEKIHVTGYGIHSGDILFIEGTDILFGDPVNTASKLG